MRPILCLFFVFVAHFLSAQVIERLPLADLPTKSRWKAAYKIPADTAIIWHQQDRINFKWLDAQQPQLVLVDSADMDSVHLPVGQYIWLKADYENLVAEWQQITRLSTAIANMNTQRLLLVYDANGNALDNAVVKFNGKQLSTNSAMMHSAILPKKLQPDDCIAIMANGDTMIVTVDEKNGYWNNSSQVRQWKRLPVIRQIINAPGFVKSVFNNTYKYSRSSKQRSKQQRYGFFIFNKPLYKQGDTLRLKAWITDRKSRPLTKDQELWINYWANNRQIEKKITTLSNVSAGSYLYNMVLTDSFPSDTRYTIQLRGKRKFERLTGNFSTEEYTLPDISSFSFKSKEKEYHRKDTLRFTADAKDANGLALLDARINLRILSGNVASFYAAKALSPAVDTMFIPDTLFTQTYALQTDGKTDISVPASLLPAADMELKIEAELVNSSNEVKEQTIRVKLSQHEQAIQFFRQGDSVRISFVSNSIEEKRRALITMTNDDEDNWQTDSLVTLPFSQKIHPLATTIEAEVYKEDGSFLNWNSWEVEDVLTEMRPGFINDSRADTIGFQVSNPAGLDLYITLQQSGKIIWQRQMRDKIFTYAQKGNKRHLYRLQAKYVIDGKEQQQEMRLVVPYKMLQVNVSHKQVVEPGEKDILQVAVTDYKNRPVSYANLTAAAQNLQLKEKMSFPNLPIKMKVKVFYEKALQSFKTDELALSKKSVAKEWTNSRRFIGLDTMLFYKWLFMEDSMAIHKTVIKSTLPEVAIYAIKNGKPEPVYIEYLNRQPVWYFGVNALQANSHVVPGGYTQIAIRTIDQYIQMDSVYIQPYYKHDIVLNIDSLLRCKTVLSYKKDKWLDNAEMQILGQHFARFERHAQNENALLWQHHTVIKLVPDGYKEWIAGPFRTADSVYAYKPDMYSFKFPFEPQYRYRLSQQLTRMERTVLLAGKEYLMPANTRWRLGEIVPNIEIPVKPAALQSKAAFLKTTANSWQSVNKAGGMQLQWPQDTLVAYTVVVPIDSIAGYKIYPGKTTMIHSLKAGRYKLLAVNKNNTVTEWPLLHVRSSGVTCVKIKGYDWQLRNVLVDSIRDIQLYGVADITKPPVIEKEVAPVLRDLPLGNAMIKGCIKDAKSGGAIPSVAVMIKGTKTGTVTDTDGCFSLRVPDGKYVLVYSSVGYESATLSVTVRSGIQEDASVKMKVASSMLNDVIVVGYGVQRKQSLTGSVAALTIEEALQGRVSGLIANSNADDRQKITIRGVSSLRRENGPLYVVDGVLMDVLPTDLDTSVANVEVLKSAVATSIYGARAANGVVLITTGRNSGPVIRTIFRDDAYWQPNIITDGDGKASIPVQYPENITSWQNIIYATASKGRYGRTFSSTKTFKAVQGLLTVPQFLLAGDSVQVIGKAMNYSSNDKVLHSMFKWNSHTQQTSGLVKASAASTSLFGVRATQMPDTITASYRVQDDKDHADGEQRTIPVLPVGSTETNGQFWVLDADTTVSYTPAFNNAPVTLYAENNLLDLLEKELESLRNYPQACMEQTANKLWALVMMRQIKEATRQPFKYQKNMKPLLDRLLKHQQFDGGWAWWQSGNTNLSITTKVLQSLAQLDSTATIHQAKRNGYLFLQNNLAYYLRGIKNGKAPFAGSYLEGLLCLAEGKHQMDYGRAIDTLLFDSLSLHQQWQYTRIKQLAGKSVDTELAKLWKKRNQAMLGALSWGEQSWYWYNNINATTVIAYKVLRSSASYNQYCTNVKQYFLTSKNKSWYRNTVEQAEITAVLLQDALLSKTNNTAARLTINGNKVISQFPAKIELPATTATISKQGNGLLYLTAYQQWQNPAPKRVDSLFAIRSRMVVAGDTLPFGERITLKAGSTAAMVVNVTCKELAEYVQVEIPIPAGCYYAAKPASWENHREYLKDKVVIFIEKMNAGTHQFVVPLEMRFTGSFTLNPAKAALMYFPTFYGRDNMRQVYIE